MTLYMRKSNQSACLTCMACLLYFLFVLPSVNGALFAAETKVELQARLAILSKRSAEAQKKFSHELDSLALALKKKGINISQWCILAKSEEELNAGNTSGEIVIASAALDSGCDESLYQKRYPEIWSRSWIIAMEDFDRRGRKTILYRRFVSPGVLELRMLDSTNLKNDKESLNIGYLKLDEIGSRMPEIPSDALVQIVRKGGNAAIEVTCNRRLITDSGWKIFKIRVLLQFNRDKFGIAESSRIEMPNEK